MQRPDIKVIQLETEEEVRRLIQYHNKHSLAFPIDTETTGLSPQLDRLISIQILGNEPFTAAVFDPKYVHLLLGLKKEMVLVGHNLKFDLNFLYQAGVDLRGYEWRDTLALHHLLDENKEHSLDSIIKELWGDDYKTEFWSKYKEFDQAPTISRLEYSGKDVVYTGLLFDYLQTQIQADGISEALLLHVHRLASSLLDTEIQGIPVDVDYLHTLGVKCIQEKNETKALMVQSVQHEIEAIEMDMWLQEMKKRKTEKGKLGVKKPEFSFDSPKQLIALLYDKLALPAQKNDKTKNVSTDDASLEKLGDAHPVLPLIRKYREIQKIYTTYIEGVITKQINGRCYPNFNVSGTATGRVSHSGPNMANIPASGGIRAVFRASPGHKIISADYGQLEIRIAAHFTRDPNLLKIINEGVSMHDITAQSLDIPRDRAKMLNFAEQYGAGVWKVSKILGVTVAKAEELHKKYWETFSGQKEFVALCNKKVDDGEPIISPFGRKRRFEKKERKEWDGAYRQAYNSLIQGTGSDLTSRSFYLISEELKRCGEGRGLFTVHDEVLIEVLEDKEEFWARRLEEIMVNCGNEIGLTVPLTVEVSKGSEKWED